MNHHHESNKVNNGEQLTVNDVILSKCDDCEKTFLSKDQLESHGCLKCKDCSIVASSAKEAQVHEQTLHKTVVVDIPHSVQINCDYCEYTCIYNIQLKKHIQRNHDTATEAKYKCRDCNFTSHYYLYMWKHREDKHDNNSEHLMADSKDMSLALIAEQNIDVYLEFESLNPIYTGL